jgi:hypothetical protein
VNVVISDASTEDWSVIGIKLLSVALNPKGGGSPVTIYTAPAQPPTINLVQLDQLGEIIGNAQIAPGTYTSATLTVSGNPGDVLLTTAADPEAGFDGGVSQTIPAGQIQIQGATGASGSKTVAISVNLVSPLAVTANQTNALDLEFDLSHPAFIVEHKPLSGSIIWSVNFNGPVRHHPFADFTRIVLRHLYAQVSSVSPDDSSITVTRQFPTEPPVPSPSPETAVASTQTLQILADSTNGTIYYDVDAKAPGTTIYNFSSIASFLPTKYVRIAARYQSNGTLVAVRLWASSSFNSVWISPEGHVLHVNTATDVVTVQDELGAGVPVTVNANTEFFFRTPWDSTADATPIACATGCPLTGLQFLADNELVRGFKVHISALDPLAASLTAQTVDIEIAKYDGDVSTVVAGTSFEYTRTFNTAGDNYTKTLDYISSSTKNGTDPNTGAALTGFKWWDFAFPTRLEDSADSTTVISDFQQAINGGTAGMPVWGAGYTTWNDPARANDWSALWTVLEPTPLALATVSSPWAPITNGTFTGGTFSGGTFGVMVKINGVSTPVTVDVNTASGSVPLVYQVDNTNGVVTVSAVDITTTAVQSKFISPLPVKIYGIPQPNGNVYAYVIFYYTGIAPTD